MGLPRSRTSRTDPHEGRRPPPHLRRYSSVYRGVAWSIGLAAVVVAGLLWMHAPITYEAAPGQVLDVRLPDGSNVILNSGTKLRRARLFEGLLGSRTVQLEGRRSST